MHYEVPQQNEESKVIENENNGSNDNSENENRENENNNNVQITKNKRGARGKKRGGGGRGGILNSRAATVTHRQLKAAEKVTKDEIP